MLCKAVLTICIFATISLYVMCLGVLCYISLYALNLHSTLAHLWVPFSLGVSQNKRTSAMQSNKLKLSLHINSNRNLLIIINILFTCVIGIHKPLLI